MIHADEIKLNKKLHGKRYNKNSAKYKQKWVEDHYELVSTKRKIYKRINKDAVNACNRMRAARKRGNYCEHISKDTLKDLKEMFGNKCAYCGSLEPSKLVWDHVYPISKGGCHTVDNLILACESCNLHKHAKLPLQWFAALQHIADVW